MEAWEQLIDERMEKALAVLREGPGYMAALTAQRDALDSLLERIPDEKIRKAVTAYDEQKNDVSGIQLKAVYKAGALDAVKLLKTMGVI